MSETKYIDLRLPQIGFEMPITDAIMELEQLRYKRLSGTTHPNVFFQLKHIFHMLESIGSSRIEGNNTTVMDYVETAKLQNELPDLFDNEDIKEIQNVENAMNYIEQHINDIAIDKMLLRELHSLTVLGLSANREGAMHPGQFRSKNVRISGSSHVPPDFTQVEPLIDELIEFVNREDAHKYDLLKIAIAHHRFVWIHPFENGNGRVVRLFTYALLLSKNIIKSNERIINPTAVFCSDRTEYYKHLAMADKGTDEGLIDWAEYVLSGLKIELEKVDKLVDYKYLHDIILSPALNDAKTNSYITETEFNVLRIAISKQVIQAADLKNILSDKSSSEISRIIRGLVGKKMLCPIYKNARKYTIAFSNSLLIRSILTILDRNDFLPRNNVSL